MKPPITRRHSVRGLSLAYHCWGADDAPVVLCLHGFLDHGRSFTRVAEALSDAFRVIAVDFRGHGESEWVGAGGYYHFYDYYHDITSLLEELDVNQACILGHSMGGSVATGIAAMHGERVSSLVLLEGMGPPTGAADEYPDRLTRWVKAQRGSRLTGDVASRRASRRVMESLDDAAQRLRSINDRLTHDRALELASTFTEPASAGDGLVWRFDPLHRTPSPRPFYLPEARRFWGAIAAPVLSLWGDVSQFPVDAAQDRHASLSSVRVAKVAGASHNIHHERWDLVAAAARQWFSGDRQGPFVDGVYDVAPGLD